MDTEKCSKCDRVIDESAQAHVFGGEIVCQACDKLLRQGYTILGAGGSGESYNPAHRITPGASGVKRRFCVWGLFSFLLILLPYIGLPLGIVGLIKISKSNGMLYGKTLAWIAVVLNSLALLFIIFLIVLGAIETIKGG